LPFKTPVVVTLNPAREPDPAKVIAEFDYAHPIFDGPAIAAQQRLADVQGDNGIWLAGAWGSYGFHEDGLKSALRVVNGMGIKAPWQHATAPLVRCWKGPEAIMATLPKLLIGQVMHRRLRPAKSIPSSTRCSIVQMPVADLAAQENRRFFRSTATIC
jgi:hypothetical protein